MHITATFERNLPLYSRILRHVGRWLGMVNKLSIRGGSRKGVRGDAHKCGDHAPYFAHARSAVIKYFRHSHSGHCYENKVVVVKHRVLLQCACS